jgi:hypothetical protein
LLDLPRELTSRKTDTWYSLLFTTVSFGMKLPSSGENVINLNSKITHAVLLSHLVLGCSESKDEGRFHRITGHVGPKGWVEVELYSFFNIVPRWGE